MSGPESRSLHTFLKRQYWLFTAILAASFIIASAIVSASETYSRHREDCQKFSERLADLEEILTREAVIGSVDTIEFELNKLRDEFPSSRISYSPQAPQEASGCQTGLSGFQLLLPLNFGSSNVGTIKVERSSQLFAFADLATILIPVLASFVTSFLLLNLLRHRFEDSVVRPLVGLADEITNRGTTGKISIQGSIREYAVLQAAINEMVDRIKDSSERIRTLEISEEVAKMSRQVAHDIRSPLSALKMMERDLGQLPEDRRTLMRTAIQRINDIANELLRKSKDIKRQGTVICSAASETAKADKRCYSVSTLIDSLISEKRVEYRSKVLVKIEADLSEAYGIFVELNPQKFQRSLSNLINNAVEALPDASGTVSVKVSRERDAVVIGITDDGIGMPAEVVERLGLDGFTHAKASEIAGNGLGVAYAMASVREFGGVIKFYSKVKSSGHATSGTTVEIKLPTSKAPSWFVGSIDVTNSTRVVALDDDQSIHEIWKNRFNGVQNEVTQKVLHFSSIHDFEAWYQAGNSRANDVFLVDFEFLGQNGNGLDVVERLGCEARSILVSGRADELEVQAKCLDLKVGLIPKGQAPYVPIRRRLGRATDCGILASTVSQNTI